MSVKSKLGLAATVTGLLAIAWHGYRGPEKGERIPITVYEQGHAGEAGYEIGQIPASKHFELECLRRAVFRDSDTQPASYDVSIFETGEPILGYDGRPIGVGSVLEEVVSLEFVLDTRDVRSCPR